MFPTYLCLLLSFLFCLVNLSESFRLLYFPFHYPSSSSPPSFGPTPHSVISRAEELPLALTRPLSLSLLLPLQIQTEFSLRLALILQAVRSYSIWRKSLLPSFPARGPIPSFHFAVSFSHSLLFLFVSLCSVRQHAL